MRRGYAMIVLAGFAAVMPGCTPSQAGKSPPLAESSNSIADTSRRVRIVWPYWPRSMRLHPLTRLVRSDAGDQIIEARVEMRDRDGHTTKACGLLRLDLYDASDETPGGSLAEWNLDLREPGLNRERFDDVTLTYLFRLEVDDTLLPERPVVWAYFLADDGADLSARFELPRSRR